MSKLKELLSSKKALSILLICVIILSAIFIGFAVHLAIRRSSQSDQNKTDNQFLKSRLNLQDSLQYRLNNANYYWRNDILIYQNNRNHVTIRYPNGTSINLNHFKMPIYSSDMSRALFSTQFSKMFRHSKTALFYARKVDADTLKPVGNKVYIGPKMTSNPGFALQHFTWAPVGSRCAFVHEGNLYWSDDPLTTTEAISITKNSSNENMSFGIPDWIYEEEVLMNSFAYWWSPDSESLAFLGIDDSQVSTFRMYMYESVTETLYGSFINIRYPKAGQRNSSNNPLVSVFIYSIKEKQLVTLEPPEQLTKLNGSHYYVEFVRWYDASVLLIGWVSRQQTLGFICSYRLTETTCKQIYDHQYSDGWINLLKQNNEEPIANEETKSLFTVLPNPNSPGVFRNIAQLKGDSVSDISWLAPQSFDVSDILHYEASQNFLYYTMAAPVPTQLNLYRLNLKSNQSVCLSCEDPECSSNSFSLSKSSRFVIKNCYGPGIPKIILYSVNQENLTKIIDLSTNDEANDFYRNKSMPSDQIKSFKIHVGTQNETLIYSQIIYPPNFDESKVYPVVYNVYGGPFYQVVTTKFQVTWRSYLASSLDTIVVQADARGTPNRGRNFETAIYKNMGSLEIKDHYAIIEEIASWKFVNKNKIGIYGASYGGFAVGHLLGLSDNQMLRCGISIAPVTDFRLYDTVYTERYSGLYSENEQVYQRTNIGDLAENFKDKELLLIHGTGDDNVHFINSAQFIKILQEQFIDFDLMVYPDEDHSIGNRRYHMYKHMTRFMFDCFDKVSHRYTTLRDEDL